MAVPAVAAISPSALVAVPTLVVGQDRIPIVGWLSVA
jgi:hypothetical protein